MEFKIYRSNEAELINGCIRRQRGAQKQLYDMYSATMYGTCCRYIKDTMAAEDVLVVAFTKVFENIDKYRGEGSFEGWVKRIVINEALIHLRKQRSMFVVTELEESLPDTESDGNYDFLEQEDLMSMIDQLSPGYRNVFNLFAIDGYSHKEIAEKLGISESTSKSQLNRARSVLQKLLLNADSAFKKKHHGKTS